jgi:hypothetical protein
MSHPLLNLAACDFDAYAPEKATSNAYSRPRLELKQRALAWARVVVARLAEQGIAVDVHGSDEHPSLRNRKRVDCQWLFFWRDQAARDELDRLLDRGRSIAAEIDDPSPFTRHAFLALRLDSASVEVCFAVHPEARVDVENLSACLAEGHDEDAAALTTALRALPEQFAIGTSPDDRVPASAATPEALRALIERAAAGQVPLWIGWSVGRDAALEHSALVLGEGPERPPTLDEQLEDAIVALAPIYRLIAWSRENDRIALDRRIESAEQERARAHALAEAQTERWRTEQAEARRSAAEQARARAVPAELLPAGLRAPAQGPVKPAKKRSLEALFAPRAPSAHDPRPQPPRKPPSTPPAPARDDRAPVATAPAAPAQAVLPSVPATPPVVEKGVKVRVLSGPFVDKVGVIGELDSRGGARVLLGLLSTRLEVADLEPVVEGRERPALQSSHRRPLPPAPRKAR